MQQFSHCRANYLHRSFASFLQATCKLFDDFIVLLRHNRQLPLGGLISKNVLRQKKSIIKRAGRGSKG
jgi:hypothetical protein